jgi:hypothetical protein
MIVPVHASVRVPILTVADVQFLTGVLGNKLLISYNEFEQLIETYTPGEFSMLERLLAPFDTEYEYSILIRDFENVRTMFKNSLNEFSSVQHDIMSRMIQLGASWGDAVVYCEEVYASEYCPITFVTVDPNDNDDDFLTADDGVGIAYSAVADDEDADLPKFRFRKDVCEHFPVVIAKTESKDRTDRYSVVWHFSNLKKQCLASPLGRKEFTKLTEIRLMKALRKCPFWAVEETSLNTDILCVLAMNFDDTKPRAAPIAASAAVAAPIATSVGAEENLEDSPKSNLILAALAAPIAAATDDTWITIGKPATNFSTVTSTTKPVAQQKPHNPFMASFRGIKDKFPVIWAETESTSNEKIYSISIFNKRVVELNLNANNVKTELVAALRASKAWVVLGASNNREVCRIRVTA